MEAVTKRAKIDAATNPMAMLTYVDELARLDKYVIDTLIVPLIRAVDLRALCLANQRFRKLFCFRRDGESVYHFRYMQLLQKWVPEKDHEYFEGFIHKKARDYACLLSLEMALYIKDEKYRKEHHPLKSVNQENTVFVLHDPNEYYDPNDEYNSEIRLIVRNEEGGEGKLFQIKFPGKEDVPDLARVVSSSLRTTFDYIYILFAFRYILERRDHLHPSEHVFNAQLCSQCDQQVATLKCERECGAQFCDRECAKRYAKVHRELCSND